MLTILFELYERDRQGKPYLLLVSSSYDELTKVWNPDAGDWIEAHQYVRIVDGNPT